MTQNLDPISRSRNSEKRITSPKSYEVQTPDTMPRSKTINKSQ